MMFRTEEKDRSDESGQGKLRPPIKALEARVFKFAKHHEGQEKHEHNQAIFGVAKNHILLVLILGEHQKGDGRDHTRRKPELGNR